MSLGKNRVISWPRSGRQFDLKQMLFWPLAHYKIARAVPPKRPVDIAGNRRTKLGRNYLPPRFSKGDFLSGALVRSEKKKKKKWKSGAVKGWVVKEIFGGDWKLEGDPYSLIGKFSKRKSLRIIKAKSILPIARIISLLSSGTSVVASGSFRKLASISKTRLLGK